MQINQFYQNFWKIVLQITLWNPIDISHIAKFQFIFLLALYTLALLTGNHPKIETV
jgi:hypothetical protein